MKAIETRYKGHRFRSRLEARWAVFFDALGLDWQYEPEGYDLGEAGWYLPDFWIENIGVRDTKNLIGAWAEIKGSKASDSEKNKCSKLSDFTEKSVILLQGGINNVPCNDQMEEFSPEIWDAGMLFCKCWDCGRIKYEYCESNYMYCESCGSTCNDMHPSFGMATISARSARFEHGESPL